MCPPHLIIISKGTTDDIHSYSFPLLFSSSMSSARFVILFVDPVIISFVSLPPKLGSDKVRIEFSQYRMRVLPMKIFLTRFLIYFVQERDSFYTNCRNLTICSVMFSSPCSSSSPTCGIYVVLQRGRDVTEEFHKCPQTGQGADKNL